MQQFCEDICDAVEAWLPHVVAPEARARLEGLPTIEVMTLPFELHAR